MNSQENSTEPNELAESESPSDEGHQADLDLCSRALARDPEAQAEFIERMRIVPRLLAHKNRRRGMPFDHAELEDLAQDALIAIWRKLDSFEGRSALEAWASRFAHYEFIYRLRTKPRRPVPLAEPEILLAEREIPRPQTHEAQPFDAKQLQDAVDRLKPAESEVIRLKHQEALTFQEIGARLTEPPNTVKTRYYRGIRRLQKLFGTSQQLNP